MTHIKLRTRISAHVTSALITVTSGFIFLTISPASANNSQVCNNPPGGQKGDTNLDSRSTNVQGYVLKIQLRYRSSTKQKWARGCMPLGTSLYLKDRKGNMYGQYTAGVHGWNYADKIKINTPVQACAKHPDNPNQFCTGFF